MALTDSDLLLVNRSQNSYKISASDLVPYLEAKGIGAGGASVHVGENEPADAEQGDLWWKSDDGYMYVYYIEADYNDGAGPGTAQWVEASPGDGGQTTHVGSAPPADYIQGDLWFDTNSGGLFVYYVDANTSQWVQVGGSSTPGGGGGGGIEEAPEDGKKYTRLNATWVEETGLPASFVSTPVSASSSSIDLTLSNHFTFDADMVVPNTSNNNTGQTGLFIFLDTVTALGWSSGYKFPDDEVPEIPAAGITVLPYYVSDSSTVFVGRPTGAF